jgi:hypothetical protein
MSKSIKSHFVPADDNQEYFVKEHYQLQDRNKLDTEVRHLCRENIDGTYMNYAQLKVVYRALLTDIDDLNEQFPKVRNKINPPGMHFMRNDGTIFITFHEGLQYVAYPSRKNLTHVS